MSTKQDSLTSRVGEILSDAFAATATLAALLVTLADLRRALIIEDRRSPWHPLLEAAVRDINARVVEASTMVPLGTRSVAEAVGTSPGTVSAACASGDLPADVSDSRQYLVRPSEVLGWSAPR